jgi:hypothetical protein
MIVRATGEVIEKLYWSKAFTLQLISHSYDCIREMAEKFTDQKVFAMQLIPIPLWL